MSRLGGDMERCSILGPFVNLDPDILDELSYGFYWFIRCFLNNLLVQDSDLI